MFVRCFIVLYSHFFVFEVSIHHSLSLYTGYTSLFYLWRRSVQVATAAEEYWYHMGLAFQIVDDILDIVGAADVRAVSSHCPRSFPLALESARQLNVKNIRGRRRGGWFVVQPRFCCCCLFWSPEGQGVKHVESLSTLEDSPGSFCPTPFFFFPYFLRFVFIVVKAQFVVFVVVRFRFVLFCFCS